MDFNNIPQTVLNDFTKTLALKYFKHLKSNWNQEQYVDENGSIVKWQPLTPDYEKYKISKVGEQKILVYDGDMLNSFEYEVNGAEFRIWNPVEYAKYHQEGTDNMPARPMLFFDTQFIENEFIKYISQSSNLFNDWVKKQILL